jgi:hypothetical protein
MPHQPKVFQLREFARETRPAILEVNIFYRKLALDQDFAERFHQAAQENNVEEIMNLIREAGVTMTIDQEEIKVEVSPEGSEVGIDICNGEFCHGIHFEWADVSELRRNARILYFRNLELARLLRLIAISHRNARLFDTAVGNGNLRRVRFLLRLVIRRSIISINRIRPTVRQIRFDVCSRTFTDVCADIDMRW